ncbi:MAG: hypothetical protein IPK77_11485 [Cellvibrio sp.]|nr:hypothetical protein [Cellvibrio sp.]
MYVDTGIGLAHTRLSIIDISDRSNQPFWDESGRYCIIFNGEIYNFQEIRTKLEAMGVEFRTSGDTEVLLKAIVHFGEKIINDLMGMFSFCFYDKQSNVSILCQDRFGIKPLYYALQSNRLVFSSEQAPILKSVGSSPDVSSIFSYLLGSGESSTVRALF